MLTTKGIFSGLQLGNRQAHIDKLRSMFKSYVGNPDLDMNVIGLRQEMPIYVLMCLITTPFILGIS